MTIENPEMPAVEEEKEPVFFVSKRVSMISDMANILSWIVLVGFIGSVIAEIVGLRAQLASQGIALATLVKEPSLYTFLFTNMIVPLLTGLGLFALLQGVSIGLSMLLEWDFNMREGKK